MGASHTRRRSRVIAIVSVTAAALLASSAGVAQASRGWDPRGSGGSRGDACGPLVPKATGGTWSCTFDDEFSGTSLDTSKWVVGTTATTGFVMGPTCFTANNVSVGGGTLNLTARDLGKKMTCSSPYGSFSTQYTGAHVGTVGRFKQAYGRFEVRARYPQSGSGLHGGWWLYPDKLTYGAWPDSGEIDATEWWSSAPSAVLPTLHYAGSTSADTGWGCHVGDPTIYHTYTVVWLPTVIQVAVDGQTCFSDTWTPDSPLVAPQPFDRPFDIILNMAIDNTANNALTASTTLPATYQVDYVKAWQ